MESLADQFPLEDEIDKGIQTGALTQSEAEPNQRRSETRRIRLADLGSKPGQKCDAAADVEARNQAVERLITEAADAQDAATSADAEQRQEVLRTFNLFRQAGGPDSACEVRIFENRDNDEVVAFGYFDDRAAIARLYDGEAEDSARQNVYITLNPVKRNLLDRSPNAFSTGKGASCDSNVESRKWFLVDCDPKRPSGTASSQSEHDAAQERAQNVRDYLCSELGWPQPVLCDSGNGAHLLFRIDLPNDDVSTRVVKNCLEALEARFSDAIVTIDTSVGNAARITRFYGTTNHKGIASLERPHRRSRIISTPNDGLGIVTRAQLEALASQVKQTTLADLDKRPLVGCSTSR